MIPLNLKINTDGGSRGNPGPAAIGIVIKDESQKLIHQFGKTIGTATNNIAEYQAVIAALNWLNQKNLSLESIHFFLDSTLVVNQLNGLWKVKDPNLRQKVIKIRQLEAPLKTKITYQAIPREKNFEPDALLNQALDQA